MQRLKHLGQYYAEMSDKVWEQNIIVETIENSVWNSWMIHVRFFLQWTPIIT